MKEEEVYSLKAFLDRSTNRRQILEILKEQDKALRPTEIAKLLKTQRTTISKRITDLEERGLVKILNPNDNRNRYYKITDKGRELLK